MKTSAFVKPPTHSFYGNNWKRSLDPWHKDAFPDEFKRNAPRRGKRLSGWMLEDGFGNEIFFIKDGTEL